MIREIRITPVLNGFIVSVGCQQVVFDSIDKVVSTLRMYLEHPQDVEQQFVLNSCNAKHFPGAEGAWTTASSEQPLRGHELVNEVRQRVRAEEAAMAGNLSQKDPRIRR